MSLWNAILKILQKTKWVIKPPSFHPLGWFGGGFFILTLWGAGRRFAPGTGVNLSNSVRGRCNGAEGFAEGFNR